MHFFSTRSLILLSFIALAVRTGSTEESQARGVFITPITRNATKSKATLTLAAKGKALMPIVISEKASAKSKAVAAELAAA